MLSLGCSICSRRSSDWCVHSRYWLDSVCRSGGSGGSGRRWCGGDSNPISVQATLRQSLGAGV